MIMTCEIYKRQILVLTTTYQQKLALKTIYFLLQQFCYPQTQDTIKPYKISFYIDIDQKGSNTLWKNSPQWIHQTINVTCVSLHQHQKTELVPTHSNYRNLLRLLKSISNPQYSTNRNPWRFLTWTPVKLSMFIRTSMDQFHKPVPQ